MKSITTDIFKKFLIYSIIPFLIAIAIFYIILKNRIYENINQISEHHVVSIHNKLSEEINTYNHRITHRIIHSITKNGDLADDLKYFIYTIKGLYDIYIVDKENKILYGESKFYHIEKGKLLNIESKQFQHVDNDILIKSEHQITDNYRLIFRHSIRSIFEIFDANMDNMNTFILDKKGNIVYHTNPIIYLKGINVSSSDFFTKDDDIVKGFFNFIQSEYDKKVYMFIMKNLDKHLYFGTYVEENIMNKNINKIYLQLSIIFMAYFLLLYFISRYLSEYVSKQVIALSKFSSDIIRNEETRLDIYKLPDNEIRNVAENLIKSIEKIKSLKDELHITILSIGDGVIITDEKGNIKLFNKAAENITGYNETEVKGKNISEIFHLMDDLTCKPIENPVVAALREQKRLELSEHTILFTKNGEKKIISDSASPVLVDGVLKGIVLIFRDETEKEKFKREMIRKQQIETIGLVAGGIAHDFNNILSAIYNYMSISKINFPEDINITKFADQIMELCERGRFLSNKLLILSKGGEHINLSNVDLYKLLADTAKFVLIGSSITFNISQLNKDCCCIVADENLISQVLHNIILNAKQAMSESGNINIVISLEDLQEKGNRPYIKISIKDEGPGIDKEQIEKIFEPFFTTKNGGTGLGLYIAKSIIEKHDGIIKVFSENGAGTEFVIYLPYSNKCVLEKNKDIILDRYYDLKVIVMDDDFFVRDSLTMLLESVGCKVYQAENGDEASELYEKLIKKGEEIDLLFLDVTVPEGKGAKYTLEKVKTFVDNPKAVVMSGYTDSDLLENHLKYGFIDVLPKPFKQEKIIELLKKIKSSH